MAISQSVSLKPYNTFQVPATAAYFATIHKREELEEAISFAEAEGLPIQILAGGSNVLFVRDFPGVILHIENNGIEWLGAFSGDSQRVRLGAGENWHNFVNLSLRKRLYGLENLALIPGTVGAAPIQNIGAYGAELANYFVELSVYDQQEKCWKTMNKSQCEFSYRDSLFKRADRGRYIIFDVTLELSTEWQPNLNYAELESFLVAQTSSAETVFDAVCAMRRSKLPDPRKLGNAGSFFKNPIISEQEFIALSEELPGLPRFELERGLVKIPAAWLLDKLGWKGRSRGPACVYEKHALVLVNLGDANGEDILLLSQEMSSSVLECFGIALEPEVQIL